MRKKELHRYNDLLPVLGGWMRRWIAGLVLPSNDAPPAVTALASPHDTAVRLGPSVNDPKMPTTTARTN